jgi:hypothetical protein
MATIPMGSFGETVARPGPMPTIPRGDAIGQATERVGQIATGIVSNIAEEQRRAQLQAEHEQKQRDAEVAHAALKAKTITALTGTKDALADLHDTVSNGVIDGSIPKDKAESTYSEGAAKVLGNAGLDLPDSHRQVVLAELNGDAGRLGNNVRKAVTTRERMDVTSGINQTLEYLQRSYAVDPAKSTQQAMDTIDQLGPHSTLNPDQVGKLKQSWKEGTQYTTAYTLVSQGRNSRKGLEQADNALTGGFPDLDPQKRATLTDRVQAYRMHLDQKDEMAAARAEREAQRRLHQAEAEFNTFSKMADKGTALDPDYTDRAIAATTGTPYQAGIVALARQAKETGGIAAQPIQWQQQQLDAINTSIAKNGRSPEMDARKDQVEKVLRGSQADLDKDALRAGLERGVITDLRPLDLSKGMPGMIQQLAERTPLAQRVSVWAGRSVSPMTDDEAGQLKHQLDSLPAKDRAGMVAALAQAVGPQSAQGMATQLDKKDKGLALAFAFAGASTTNGRYTSELLLKGQQAKLDGTSTKNEKLPDVKVAQWSAHIASSIDGLFPAQTLTDQTREAAVLIAHGLAAEAGGALREKDLDRAVGFAIGGSIVEHNGRKVPLPAGVDEDMLDKRLRSVSVQELAKQAPEGMVRAGGAPMALDEFAKSLPGQQLMYAGPGRFAIIVSGRPVLNGQGKPILIGVQ